jgi:hypothetical protein
MPIEWLETIYETIGPKYPILSLFGAIILCGAVGGCGWYLLGKHYEKDHPRLKTATRAANIAVTPAQTLPPTPEDKQPATESKKKVTERQSGTAKSNHKEIISDNNTASSMRDSPGRIEPHNDGPNNPNVTVQPGGVASINQQGGQTAQTINNFGPLPPPTPTVKILHIAPTSNGNRAISDRYEINYGHPDYGPLVCLLF